LLRQFQDQSKRAPFPARPIADVYVGLGEKDLAFQWLNKAIDDGEVYLFLAADPIYDRLRSDPRFDQLLQRASLRKLDVSMPFARERSPEPVLSPPSPRKMGL